MFLSCGHELCCLCWPKVCASRECPLCRKTIQDGTTYEVRQQLGARTDRSQPVADETPFASVELANGSFGTKINAIVRHIVHLKDKDPTTKSIVFSTWKDVLCVCRCF